MASLRVKKRKDALFRGRLHIVFSNLSTFPARWICFHHCLGEFKQDYILE